MAASVQRAKLASGHNGFASGVCSIRVFDCSIRVSQSCIYEFLFQWFVAYAPCIPPPLDPPLGSVLLCLCWTCRFLSSCIVVSFQFCFETFLIRTRLYCPLREF